MADLIETTFVGARDDIVAVRTTVFIDEQGVSHDLELDERDDHCIHVLATRGGKPVATGRIDVGHAGKIGRVAVLKAERRSGLGSAVMADLERIGRRFGLLSVWLNAQESALRFYQELGYRVDGALFVEAGIPHRRMVRSLIGAD